MNITVFTGRVRKWMEVVKSDPRFFLSFFFSRHRGCQWNRSGQTRWGWLCGNQRTVRVSFSTVHCCNTASKQLNWKINVKWFKKKYTVHFYLWIWNKFCWNLRKLNITKYIYMNIQHILNCCDYYTYNIHHGSEGSNKFFPRRKG